MRLLASMILFQSSTASEFNGFVLPKYPPTTDLSIQTFTRYVDVFHLRIVAGNKLTDAQGLHGASILAELLFNDQDGIADDKAVLSQL